jgi:hypothetical protein
MTWQVDYLTEQQVVAVNPDPDVSRCTSGGPDTPADMHEFTEIVARGVVVAAEHAVHAILIDARAMKLAAQTTELYHLPEIVQEQGLTRRHRVAVVVPGDSAQKESFLFIETVFFNRGFQVRLFAEVTTALKWLKPGKRPLHPPTGSVSNTRPRPS